MPSGLWPALIGRFRQGAAACTGGRATIEPLLQGFPVSRFMIVNAPTVPPNIPVSTLVYDYLFGTDAHSFPVIDNDRLAGLVCIGDVRKVPRVRWERTEVGEIMTGAGQLVAAWPEERVSDALEDMLKHSVNQLPVVQNGRLVGMLHLCEMLYRLHLLSKEEGRTRTENQIFLLRV